MAPVISEKFRRRAARGDFTLPWPGAGHTAERWMALAEVAGEDLSLGRLAEGHADALAILHEADRAATAGEVYGVWAARSGDADVNAMPGRDGWVLSGAKAFCSGARACTRALVTASADDGYRLFEVDADLDGVCPVDNTWPAVGMQGSDSLTVVFESVEVPDAAAVGGPGFYLDRPGFWHGAIGVAACWWGGAQALVAATAASMANGTPGDASLAQLGEAVATVEALRSVLMVAAASVDADPEDLKGEGRRRALAVRQSVYSGCHQIMTATGSAGGARPLALDGTQSRRLADLGVYLAQHHAGRDATALGRAAADEATGGSK